MSNVTVNVQGIEGAQQALNTVRGGLSPFPESIKRQIAQTIRQLIYQRTLSGRDREGAFFRPYSPGYAAIKGGMGSSVVNLYLTGQMFGAMTDRIDNDDAVIFFADSEAARKAAKHISGEGVPVRDFFGVGEEEVQASVVRGIIQDHLDGLIRTANNAGS